MGPENMPGENKEETYEETLARIHGNMKKSEKPPSKETIEEERERLLKNLGKGPTKKIDDEFLR